MDNVESPRYITAHVRNYSNITCSEAPAQPMNIVIITQYYAPEPCAAAHRVQALAHALAARGDRVKVIAPHPNFPTGTIHQRYRNHAIIDEQDGPVRVTRLRHIATAQRFARFLAWSSFAILSAFYVTFFTRRLDCVIISSPPITLALPALAARFIHRAKLVVDVRDVFPDLPVQMRAWAERGFFATTIGALAKFLYRTAALVVVVTPTALERVRAREPRANILLAPNGADRITPAIGIIQRKNSTKTAPEFIATFAGNMGLANGLDTLLDAAKLVASQNIRIVLIGGGADLDHVQHRITEESITNVELRGVLSREQAVGALQESDASIVILREGIEESIPTKIFDAFSVACPVVLSAGGEAQRIVEEARGGICAPPGNPHALADALIELQKSPNRARTLGLNGQKFVHERYDRERIMSELSARIDELFIDILTEAFQ